MPKFKNVFQLLFDPIYNSIFLCRITLKLYEKGHNIMATFFRNRLLYKYGIHIGLRCKMGADLTFPHPQGIIIGDGVIIGNDCTIYQQVTLGKKNGNLKRKMDYPILGNNVTIFAGAKIIGNIKIGNNSVIAANSVVICDVEPNSVYAGVPARKIK